MSDTSKAKKGGEAPKVSQPKVAYESLAPNDKLKVDTLVLEKMTNDLLYRIDAYQRCESVHGESKTRSGKDPATELTSDPKFKQIVEGYRQTVLSDPKQSYKYLRDEKIDPRAKYGVERSDFDDKHISGKRPSDNRFPVCSGVLGEVYIPRDLPHDLDPNVGAVKPPRR